MMQVSALSVSGYMNGVVISDLVMLCKKSKKKKKVTQNILSSQ
jgi:hypothetical protein